MSDGTLTTDDGRTVGYADAAGSGLPLLWCNGGPGSRLEGAAFAPAAADAGFRIIGIDRPGYGVSTPQPGRTIAGWVPDALAVLQHLGVDEVATIGISTGGAYALALAASVPDRVRGVVVCCALTDMRWDEGKAMMPPAGTRDIWSAPDRETAMQYAADVFGEFGTKMAEAADGQALPETDTALFNDPQWLAGLFDNLQASFAQGVTGYTDDRIADGPGWGTFAVDAIRSPVTVIHGGSDTIVPVAHAHHTAEIVPGAVLRVFEPLGHFSIIGEAIGQMQQTLAR
jgi:pimeloyl-ACP methyl ester carboxylesterase